MSTAPISPDLAHYLAVLWRRRRVALAAAAVTMIACVMTVAIRGRTVTVSSSILVTSFDRSGIAPLPMSGSAPNGLVAALAGPKVDPIRAFLASRTLRVRVARRVEPQFEAETKGDPLRALGYDIATTDGAGGALVIAVNARRKTPESIASVNGYVLEELETLLSEGAVTDTKRQRLFTERLLAENSDRRREIEEALMGFSPDGTIALDPKMADLLARASRLRERAAARVVESRALGINRPDSTVASLETANDASPPVDTLLEEAAALQAEARHLSSGSGSREVVPLARLPLLALEFRRLQAELAVLDQLHALLRSQRELALINESKDAPSFAVVDAPTSSAGATTPTNRHLLTLAIASAILTAIGAAFAAELAQQLTTSTRSREHSSLPR